MTNYKPGITDTQTRGFAVMDLGTNTFHLLIANVTDGHIEEITRNHEAVKLGEGGINKGFIQPTAFERGLKTMQHFSRQIAQHPVKQVRAIATSALRNASNGVNFISQVKAQTGIAIQIIDGITEATYIYQGVKASGCLPASNALIMDIGGGSVEFILCTDERILWKQSFEIGAARLIDKFHQADPIPAEAIQALHQYLDETLAELFTATQTMPVKKLIGSAGAFETFAEMIAINHGDTFDVRQTISYDYNLNELIDVTDKVIKSSHQQRKAMRGIISLRVDMIVVASLLTRYIMDKLGIQQIGMSAYSLKEGVLVGLEEK